MLPPRLPYLHVLFWLLFLLVVFGEGLLACATWWPEVRGPIAAEGARPAPALAPSAGAGAPEAADPWARGPSGSMLDAGYAPGQQRPGLLP